MIDLRHSRFDQEALTSYAKLLKICFPKARHYTHDYLEWLYKNNPLGTVVGFDAVENERIAAHYACVPAAIELHGKQRRALLSLNTATHPEYQGKGLFKKLASATYERAQNEGFDLVYGIANANSTPGFIKRLQFNLVGQLSARIHLGGIGSAVEKPNANPCEFRRIWTPESLAWRVNNPSNPLRLSKNAAGYVIAHGRTGTPGLQIAADVSTGDDSALTLISSRFHFATLFLGALPGGAHRSGLSMEIPEFLRPSPLNMIVRTFGPLDSSLDMNDVKLTFLDFDAF